MTRAKIQSNALSIDAVIAQVQHPSAGAIDVFLGVVRDHSDGRSVARLEYQAYEAMAVREMDAIIETLESTIDGARVAIAHRVGLLEVGDIAVVAAASAPHRAEAFVACRRLIDEVKARVPIWKREFTTDGGQWLHWTDARCRAHHESTALKVQIVTVSDTRMIDNDPSGDQLAALLADVGAIERQCVRDEQQEIARAVVESTDFDIVVFTGGTGIAARDVTIESVAPLLEKTLPGFGEHFRRVSFDSMGAGGLLSRAIAGVRAKTLIFCVPGSPSAVRDAAPIIRSLASHAHDLVAGHTTHGTKGHHDAH